MPRIEIAERAGVGLAGDERPSEDYVVRTGNAVALLDGATEFRANLPSGGWYACRLARRVEANLGSAPQRELAEILADSIREVAAEHDLRPRDCPSSTVAMLRWSTRTVDALVLADSPVVVFTPSGPDVLSDTRLTRLRDSGVLRTRADVNRLRNASGGFWVAEADPTAAEQALRRSWPREQVEAVLLATDGVSVGVDTYGVLDWPGMLALAREQGTAGVLDTVRAAELSDPHGKRWPRVKRHDDQALALIDFA
ncbi:hypothetical protein SacmaDRAFT_0479 [Saccharomonospora marina XMU15]|uniref:Protein phosphatase 2C n=1 Tax=Saccharomonospora marina XMU15 TaxID=882083 RepID=H5X3B1_9PSEU|nr:protein phosphatase 2C domain-containing protein [Saccharomonospora marina]EHR48780.1 hypothetical protein SacmaDRAFT_0479 [Saccharomonospora marina XMU15]